MYTYTHICIHLFIDYTCCKPLSGESAPAQTLRFRMTQLQNLDTQQVTNKQNTPT